MPREIIAVDLFCGVGGLTNGLEQGGINVLEGYDLDPSVGFAYRNNNNSVFVEQDITKLDSSRIKKLFNAEKKKSKGKEIRTLVAGCAPCQPFSSYQKDKDYESRAQHYSYPAFENFIRIVSDVKPDFVTMENVSGITKDKNFVQFYRDLDSMGYSIDFKVVNIAYYGAPQKRRRMLLVASRVGKVEIPMKLREPIKLEDAIGHLVAVNAGEKNPNDPMHEASSLTPLNIERIRHSRPGGTWRDWPERLLPNCYRKESGKSFGAVYGRLKPDTPSNTLTTQFTRYGTGRYGHYEQDRALTLREGAIIQTFPEDYDFNVEVLGKTAVARHIGNAVPPIAGKVIAEIFKGVR